VSPRPNRILILIAAPALAALLSAALPEPNAPPAAASLAGQFLVATPAMGDPRFVETVILMVRQDKTGAFGIVINRPIEERTFASLMAALGQKDPDVKGKVRIFAGGPVEPDIGFVIHTTDYHRPETMGIDGRVSVTSSPAILRDMGHGKGPRQALVAFGYAGWGPGQLEAEIADKAWFTEPEDRELLFDADRAEVWKTALERRPRDL
jgi:putative transcriptional regulator